MTKGLRSKSGISYIGVNAPQPPNIVFIDRAPISGTKGKDIKNFDLGDIWLDTSVATPIPYMLVKMAEGKPIWSAFASDGAGASNFVTDSGTATEVGGSINVLGGDLINTVGVGDTVTVNLDRGTDGQIIVAATSSASMYADLTSSDSSITITGGANTLDIKVGAAVPLSFAGDVGTAAPALNVLTLAGGTACTTTAGGSTVTIDMDTTVATVYHTDSGDATPAANALTVAGGNNIATSGAGATLTIDLNGTTNHAVQIGNATNSLTSLAVGSDGQVLIAATGADPAFATLTSSDSSITFTAGANTLDLVVDGTVANTYTTDSGDALPSSGVLNVKGGVTSPDADSNINTYADPAASNNLKIALNNTIKWPDTNAAGTQGVIYLDGDRFMHKFGSSQNVFIGNSAGNFTMTASGEGDVGIGAGTLSSLTTGNANTGVGSFSLDACTTGVQNCALGWSSLTALTTGQDNLAYGINSGWKLLSGVDNIIIGSNLFVHGQIDNRGADAYVGGESANIIINNIGVAGESNTIRIGTSGSGDAQQNRCFMAGIRGITTGVADAVSVLIDSAGQLGTVSSSERFKQNIQDIGDQSSIIMKLRPVLFNYKKHPTIPAWGLIAEEVDKIFPQLVVYDEQGAPETVKYHDLSVLLLNELKRLSERVESLESRVLKAKE